MTDLSEARARAVEARDEARNHVENFPSSEGDAVRVARLADVIDALLAASAPVEGDEREALTRSDDDIMITIRHEGGNTLRGTVQQVCGTHLAKGWSLEAGPERRTPLRRPSTPTEEEWRAAMDAERARQIEHGYDDAHDQEHGARHPLNWAIDYARRGKALAAAAMIRSALHLSPTEEDVERSARAAADATMRDNGANWVSQDPYTAMVEAARAALSAVHPEVTQ